MLFLFLSFTPKTLVTFFRLCPCAENNQEESTPHVKQMWVTSNPCLLRGTGFDLGSHSALANTAHALCGSATR